MAHVGDDAHNTVLARRMVRYTQNAVALSHLVMLRFVLLNLLPQSDSKYVFCCPVTSIVVYCCALDPNR